MHSTRKRLFFFLQIEHAVIAIGFDAEPASTDLTFHLPFTTFNTPIGSAAHRHHPGNSKSEARGGLPVLETIRVHRLRAVCSAFKVVGRDSGLSRRRRAPPSQENKGRRDTRTGLANP
jgi:hypothetical protein